MTLGGWEDGSIASVGSLQSQIRVPSTASLPGSLVDHFTFRLA